MDYLYMNDHDFEATENYNHQTSKWGLRITGGADFEMPITVFHVTEAGPASEAGIKLGDTISSIDGVDSSKMSLVEAEKHMEAGGQKINLSVETYAENGPDGQSDAKQRNVVLHHKKQIPDDIWIHQKERKVWHPVVWQQPTGPKEEKIGTGQDAPHKRIICNIRRFFKETEGQKDIRQKYVEDMLLALPTASKQY